ncbi:MAG: HAD-IC family P-type ATPase [Candidatus Magnetobacterium sp. LHC-1]|nr:cation-transporting P-type ATPase [Nitrospirota bacterium]
MLKDSNDSNSSLLIPIHTKVRGRARFHVNGLYRCENLKIHIYRKLSGNGDIIDVSINLFTGTVLIKYKSDYEIIQLTLISILEEYYQNGDSVIEEADFKKPAPELPPQDKPGLLSGPVAKVKSFFVNVKDLFRNMFSAKNDALTHNYYPQELHPWHLMNTEEVLRHFGTSVGYGLEKERKEHYLQKYGPNVLPEAAPRSKLGILFSQFESVTVVILVAASVVSTITSGWIDGLALISAVVINAAIGFVTEVKAENTINSLKMIVRPVANVLRNGKAKEVAVEDIVPGDILMLTPGVYIAADARLLEARRLSVDESALTGESIPVGKSVHALVESDIALADRFNMVYMGTLVTGGQGLAVVTATGRYTEIGCIQLMVKESATPPTLMEQQLIKMSNQLMVVSLAICVAVFIIAMLRGYGIREMIRIAVSLAAASIPEGLTTMATTVLAIGVNNMKKHNILVRHLSAIESLGAIQTICLDKTGTITKNKMSVVKIKTMFDDIKTIEGHWDKAISNSTSLEVLRLLGAVSLCSETEVKRSSAKYEYCGTSTENSLVQAAVEAGLDVLDLKLKLPRIKIMHRAEGKNYMVTVHRSDGKGRLFGETRAKNLVVTIKGAPQEVAAFCSKYMKNGILYDMSEEERDKIQSENEGMAAEALRVLGVAYKVASENEEYKENLIWLGLVGMSDPVRKEARPLIEAFHLAGIDTVMITGDQVPTAYAIGKQIDISMNKQLEILDSSDINNIDPDMLTTLSQRVHIFARVSPAHKLQIVRALQRSGRITAMTGDGINDAPALKAAEVGIAMGDTGTDVAREVADVVLEDDNLETLITAVGYGRTMYSNIRKSIHYLLSTNMSEVVVVSASLAAGIGEPINTMQLLWINLISDVFPSIALALDPPEADIMKKPHTQEAIIDTDELKRIIGEAAFMSAASIGSYVYGLSRYGVGSRANTLSFMTLSISQLLHSLSCRSKTDSIFNPSGIERNKYLDMAVFGSVTLQVLAMFIPPLRNLLRLTPVSVSDNVVIGVSSVLPFIVNEFVKTIRTSQQEKEDKKGAALPPLHIPPARGPAPLTPSCECFVPGKQDAEQITTVKKQCAIWQ